MYSRTPSKKMARRPTQLPESRQPVGSQNASSPDRPELYGNKMKIGRLPKNNLEQASSAPGHSSEPISENKPARKANKISSSGYAKEGLHETSHSQVQLKGGPKPPKRKFNTNPMPSLRLGFAIKCKKDDLNHRYELVVESQLANRVYVVRNTKSERLCCMKIEPYDSANELKQLKRDVFVLLDAVKNPHFGSKHFLPIVNKGVCQEYFNYLVMPMCEGTLADIRENIVGGDFCPETAVRLTFDTFQAVTDLHGLGHIHRNVAPSKFVVGPGAKGLFLIGLSFAIRIVNPSQSSPRKLEHFGPNRHQSRSWHRNKHQFRRDDLESWLYMAIEFFGHKLLPWSADMSDMEVLVQKERMFNDGFDEIFYDSGAPKQLGMLLRTLNAMGAQDKPDYEFIACSLVTIREKIHCELKGPYDWTSAKKREQQQQGKLLANSPHRKKKKGSHKTVAPSSDVDDADHRAKEKKHRKCAADDDDEQNFAPVQALPKKKKSAPPPPVEDQEEQAQPVKMKRKKKKVPFSATDQPENGADEDPPLPVHKTSKKKKAGLVGAAGTEEFGEADGEPQQQQPVQKSRRKKIVAQQEEEDEEEPLPVQKVQKKSKRSSGAAPVTPAPEEGGEEPQKKPKKPSSCSVPASAAPDEGEVQEEVQKKTKKPSGNVPANAAPDEGGEEVQKMTRKPAVFASESGDDEEEPLPKPKMKKPVVQAAEVGGDRPAPLPTPPPPRKMPPANTAKPKGEDTGDDENFGEGAATQPKKVKKQEQEQPEQQPKKNPAVNPKSLMEQPQNPQDAPKDMEQQSSGTGSQGNEGDPAPAPQPTNMPIVSVYAPPKL